MQDWEEVRVRARDGVPHAVIARDLGISRSTVARAVRSDRPAVYERKVRVSKFEAFEGRVRALLAQCPDMPASVIGERVQWPFSDRALRGTWQGYGQSMLLRRVSNGLCMRIF